MGVVEAERGGVEAGGVVVVCGTLDGALELFVARVEEEVVVDGLPGGRGAVFGGTGAGAVENGGDAGGAGEGEDGG